MAMIGKVRRMKFRLKKSVREIAKATSLSRNTVRKHLRAEEVAEPKYRRKPATTKLAPFHAHLVAALKAAAVAGTSPSRAQGLQHCRDAGA